MKLPIGGQKMRRNRVGILLLVLVVVVVVVVSACGVHLGPIQWDSSTPTKTATPVTVRETAVPLVPLATYTPYPTYTAVPTVTAMPATATPTPNVVATAVQATMIAMGISPAITSTATVSSSSPAMTPSVSSVVTGTVPVTSTSCPPAEQLGPWAPSASGQGETFEVTAARGPVHASLWWPTANTPWGQAEVSVVITPGISISVINGAGSAWDYALECSQAEIDKQVTAYRATRGDWTVFYGPVTLQQLLDLKLVEIRVKRTVAAVVVPTQATSPLAVKPTLVPSVVVMPSPAVAVVCPPAVASVQVKPGDFSITGPAVASIWWTNVPETRFLVPISTTVKVLGGAGSYWVYGEGCSSDFLNKEMAKGNFPVTTVDQLRTKGLVQ